ncbi:SUN domain-containing protein 2 isoform X2 [Aplysia californica]|uniref:SUN domain-containing protein 2 isoform X2 n=1 Tax=Aplysia californica TaxID=6500 RepID=A0ABM1A1N4_APLCA|nr:SUN domain-containing protein 2 isoform X2 [Aplysia californica]
MRRGCPGRKNYAGSGSDDDTCKPKKKRCSTAASTWSCKTLNSLACITWRQVLQMVLYLASVLLILAFLYMYRGSLMHIGVLALNGILPASWLKTTNAIVDEALAKYSADRLGVADYALESAGGSVLCSSDTYYSKSGALYSVFGIPVWYHSSSPREVIQPEVQPGKCWAMHGQSGYVTIQLAMPVVVSAISLEHIPTEVAPSGRLDSAPKEFVIVGKESEMTSPDVLLGHFAYQVGNGQPIQLYDIKDPFCTRQTVDYSSCGPNQEVFRIITLKVLSNHGNPDFTCIYRLRVHGKPLRPVLPAIAGPDH